MSGAVVQSTSVSSSSTYVREAQRSDYPVVGRLLTRAFAHDPTMNWFGSVSRLVPVPSVAEMESMPLWKLPKELELLYHFRLAYALSAHLLGGRVTVLVVKDGEKEKITSVAAWYPPGAKVDDLVVVIKSGQHRPLLGSWRRPGGWGLRGLKRALIDCERVVEKLHRSAFGARNLKFKSTWTLTNVATDPDEVGKGYCGQLIRHGFEHIVGPECPIILETTSKKGRDMYVHLGFEETGFSTFGKGVVTKEGLAPRKGKTTVEELPGIPGWTMIRMPASKRA